MSHTNPQNYTTKGPNTEVGQREDTLSDLECSILSMMIYIL